VLRISSRVAVEFRVVARRVTAGGSRVREVLGLTVSGICLRVLGWFGEAAVDGQSSVGRRWLGTGEAPSRRKIVKGAAGVAAAGVAGSVLTVVIASPARAAAAAPQSTTVETGAIAPAVVALTDAATISVDASLGNDFRVTLGASRTMGNPANPADGQQIVFQITQGSGGSAAITWGTAYEFSTGLPQPTLSTTAGQLDLLGFIYDAGRQTWLLAAFVNGFS
jgi:hypothetical protein